MKDIEKVVCKMMKGIIFTGGTGPDQKISAALAEEADVIVAADSGLLAAASAGIKPDWIIGDMDSLPEASMLENYAPERVLRFSRDKDFTDTELAFNKLIDEGCDEIWIAGGGGGRIDHLLGIYALFEREYPPDRWITGNENIYCLKTGHELARRVKAADIVSVFPLGDGPWEAESEGLKWPLGGFNWKRGYFGLSNVAIFGGYSIRSIRGNFLVMEISGENNGNNN